MEKEVTIKSEVNDELCAIVAVPLTVSASIFIKKEEVAHFDCTGDCTDCLEAADHSKQLNDNQGEEESELSDWNWGESSDSDDAIGEEPEDEAVPATSLATAFVSNYRAPPSFPRPYPCSKCGKVYLKYGFLLTHLKLHTCGKIYECETCGRTYSARGSLNIHRRTHTGKKPYKCDYCERAFSTSSERTIHHRTHTGERPYKCDYCEKAFPTNAELKLHRRKHTGERPYKCPFCPREFISSSHASYHLKTSHQNVN